MSLSDPALYDGALAVLTSMHGKQEAIAPILRDEMGVSVEVAVGLDTDQFGTFSHEIERTSSPLQAARSKVALGFRHMPQARIGLASEGSFGPHPHLPYLAFGRELVLMVDHESGFEISGSDVSLATNFGHVVAREMGAVCSFANRVGFPEHGLLVLGCRNNQPAPDLFIDKAVTDQDLLEAAVQKAFSMCGTAFVQTDMRAHRNPTRMIAIARATRDLVRRFRSFCPRCNQPGFDVSERMPGLLCARCGQPTRIALAEVLTCQACGFREHRPVTSAPAADPGQCDYCNP